MEILSCHNLTYFYKKDVGVKNITFHIKAGDALGLVGESGSGKSTIAQIICKFLKNKQGEIELLNKKIEQYSDKEFYKLLQYIPQNPQEYFHPKRTIRQSLEEVIDNFKLAQHHSKDELIDKAIKEVGLTERHLDQIPSKLSGGECQRASIARALLLQPKLIICDEITSALDVTIQADIMKLLKHIKNNNDVAFLFIAHDIALVSQFCEEIIVLKDGEVVEHNDVLTIVNHPQKPYTKLLLEEYGQF